IRSPSLTYGILAATSVARFREVAMVVHPTSQNRPDLAAKPITSMPSAATTSAPPSSNLSGSAESGKPDAEEARDKALESVKQTGERIKASTMSAVDDLSCAGK